jgi:hypothetical protein
MGDTVYKNEATVSHFKAFILFIFDRGLLIKLNFRDECLIFTKFPAKKWRLAYVKTNVITHFFAKISSVLNKQRQFFAPIFLRQFFAPIFCANFFPKIFLCQLAE